MNSFHCRRGQALIETVLSVPLLVLALTALLTLGYRGLVFYLTDYHLHEALVCLDDESPFECTRILEKKMRSILLFQEPLHVDLEKSKSRGDGQVRIEFKFDYLQSDLSLRKEMKFPLGS